MILALALESSRQHFERPLAPTVRPARRPLGRLELFRTMRTNMLEAYGEAAYHHLTYVSPFYGRRSLFSSDPRAIRHVLVDRPERYTRTSATFRILRPVLGRGLFLAEGEDWRFQRRTLAPAFAPRAMDLIAAVAADVTAELVADKVRSRELEDGVPIDLMRPVQNIALEVAGRSMFSTAMDRQGASLRRIFEAYGMDAGRPFPLDVLLPRGVASPRDLRRQARGRRWLAFIDAMVDQRRRLPPSDRPRDLFDLMASAEDPKSGRRFSNEELRDQFATFIIAGHETTALTLLWSLILLARAPAIQKTVAEEAAVLALTPATAARDLEKLTLTKAVIQEALRLYPPAFVIVREAKEPDRVLDHTLEPGDLFSTAPWVVHRHHAHWSEPDRFDPTRFLPGAPQPERFTYIPFGVGPRTCIGAQFALTEAVIVLAIMTRALHYRLDDHWEIEPQAVVTTYPNPIPLFHVEPRRP